MEHVQIEGITPKASRIGLGTWAMGGWMWGGTDESRSIDTICTALDRGITLIDTARVYGQGRSEEIVGKALQRWGHRDRVVLATKVGLEWAADGAPFRNASRLRTRRAHRFLRRFARLRRRLPGTGRSGRPIAETAEALTTPSPRAHQRHRRATIDREMEIQQVAPLRVVQPSDNLFERKPGSASAYCERMASSH
jgi:aryl-alcohol dehydrogenase-like predicted oxidoreductase